MEAGKIQTAANLCHSRHGPCQYCRCYWAECLPLSSLSINIDSTLSIVFTTKRAWYTVPAEAVDRPCFSSLEYLRFFVLRPLTQTI